MDNLNISMEWLKRAKSNLIHGKNVNKEDLICYGGDIFFEELCFNLQQAVEKSIKAVHIYHNIDFPYTHSISELLELLTENSIKVPEELLEAGTLTQYAVRTRYPNDAREITQEEYNEALEISEKVYNWAKKIIQE